MGPESAGLARNMGFTNIRVFLQGLPAWKNSSNPPVASDSFISTGNLVLIDARFPVEVQAGHIDRAVNIPLAVLEDAEDDFSVKRNAPVVVYGKDANETRKAISIIRDFGFRTVSAVDGGLEGFVGRGNKLVTGPAAEEIKWVRTPGANEVRLADFLKATAGDTGQIILDVRSNDEAQAGMFKNAVHIPLDQIEVRLGELPPDKEILIHCTTGGRAEMAHRILAKAGLKSKFLVADIECEDGQCEARE